MNVYLKQQGQGPALVLLHGWGFDHRIWLESMSQLYEHWTVYFVDLPGFGGSECMDWTAFKTALLHRLPASFALLGWSMGGLFALRLAIEHPDCVQRVFITGSSPRFVEDNDWPGIKPSVLSGFFKQLTDAPLQARKALIALSARGLVLPDGLDSYLIPVQKGLIPGLEILADWDLREGLSTYRNPAYFLFGRSDPIVPVKTLQAMQHRYPQFDYCELPKGAHMPFLSHNALFLKCLKDFL